MQSVSNDATFSPYRRAAHQWRMRAERRSFLTYKVARTRPADRMLATDASLANAATRQ